MLDALNRWDVTVPEAVEIQRRLREQLDMHPPPGFTPRIVAGADMAVGRDGKHGYAGIVVIDAQSMETVEEVSVGVDLEFPYVPGLLSFRELPPVAAAWERLSRVPDVVIFDGAGYAHPRRFGLACHGGAMFGVPSVGCAKSILVGAYDKLGDERGATAPLIHRGEIVGMALRTRTLVRPVYVSIGDHMDLPTAVSLVLRMATKYREPETTRRAHHLVTELRRIRSVQVGR